MYSESIMMKMDEEKAHNVTLTAVSLLNESGENLSDCTTPECLLHPHWKQFAEVPYGAHAGIGLIMAVISFLSIAGNGFVIYVYTRFRSLRTPTHLLIINLSVSDLGMAITGFPLYIIASFQGKWPFSSQVCEFYGFAGGAFGLLSINTLAAIAFDRYHMIVRSTTRKQRLTYKCTAFMLSIVWIYSLGWAMPPLFGWNKYTWEGFGTTCSFDYLTRTDGSKMFILAMFLGGFVVPMTIILYCYSYIMISVYRQRSNLHGSGNQTKIIKGGRSQKRRQVEIDIAKTIMLVVGLFCLSWMPYSIVSLIGVYGDQRLITPIASAIPGLIAKSSTLYNPIVYAVCLPKFKKKIRQMVLRVFCNIQGDLVVVENWSSPDDTSRMSNHSNSSLYRKPAVRARSGIRRSEYSVSSCNSSNNGNSSPMRPRQGVIVRTTKNNNHKKGDKKVSKKPQHQETLHENVNLCKVDINQAIGDDLQKIQELLKKNNLTLMIDQHALTIAKCESTL